MPIDVTVFNQSFLTLFDPNQDFIRLSGGFTLGEGPVWHHGLQCLIVNDIPASKTYAYDEKNGFRLLFSNDAKANGIFVSRDGRLLMCEHATSRLVRRDANGENLVVLADRFGNVELNSPNDVVQRSDGLIYFTDPIYGRLDKPASVPRPFPSDLRPVYMLNPDTGELRIAARDFENPNGLCFSADERILYVNDSPRSMIYAFDVFSDGSLERQRVFAETAGSGAGVPDGMKIDENGNVVCAAQGGLHWYSPFGERLGIVAQPERLLNFTFGDDDFKSIYLACAEGVYKCRCLAAGHRALASG